MKKCPSPIEMMIDKACGVPPGFKPARPQRLSRKEQDLPEASKLLLEIADHAEAWWRGYRPDGWSLRRHIADPVVNIPMLLPAHQKLARKIARWKEIGG